jgi:hypothetical protein
MYYSVPDLKSTLYEYIIQPDLKRKITGVFKAIIVRIVKSYISHIGNILCSNKV